MFICSKCGYQSPKWLGKCPVCDSWQSFEELENSSPKLEKEVIKEKDVKPLPFEEIKKAEFERISTRIESLDELLGGGIVKGEVILIGGEPGVGKSTLLLEVAQNLSSQGKVLYVCAEESPQQVSLRAERLNIKNCKDLYFYPEDNLYKVYEEIKKGGFNFLIIDSIQVVYLPKIDASQGSISQVKECANFLTQLAKSLDIVVFIIGHVTKEGTIAGPKLLEHIVDCVLYFETEVSSNFRILRSIKNRFGPSGEIAAFEMTSKGLKEAKNLGKFFLPHKDKCISGSTVVCIIEGTKPLAVELQALVSRASFGIVKRRSLGFDFNRFLLLLAVIEKRLKISLSSDDVFLNVSGGLKITDPSADLGASLAIISSFKDKEVSLDTVFIGEIGLTGEIRPVSNIERRIKEVKRLGFRRVVIPQENLKEVKGKEIEIIPLSFLKEAMKFLK